MTDKPLKLQIVRMPQRERHVFPNLPPTSTISQLKQLINTSTGIQPSNQSLYNGFPPRLIEASDDSTLVECGIKNGDTVEVRTSDQPANQTIKQGKGWEYAPSIEAGRGSMVRKDQPRDNSCLFHSIAYVCRPLMPAGSQPSHQSTDQSSKQRASHIREIVANLVASDPQTYSTSFLGSPNQLYQDHILNPDTWGGAIELSILSNHFQAEIVTFDYHYLREDVFGRERGYKNRVFLLYHGDHYDAIVWQPQTGSEQVLFSTRDDNAWLAARNYVQALHAETAKRGECTLQKEWRTNEGLKRRDDRTAEKERIKRANELAAKRQRDESMNANVADMMDTDVQVDDQKSISAVDNTEWTCSECTLQNSRSTMMCAACGAPSPFYDAEYFPASTNNQTQSSRTTASTTQSSKPSQTSTTQNRPTTQSSSFVCNMCTFENSSSAARCEMCGEPNPHPPANAVDSFVADVDEDGVRAPIPQQEDQLIGGYDFPVMPPRRSPAPQINEEILGIEWSCPSCTAFNQPYTTACYACGEVHPLLFTQPTSSSSSSSSRPEAPPSGGWKKFFSSEPRWVCESCGVDNIPNLIRCKSCKAPNIHALQRAQAQGGNCSIM